MKLFTIAFLFFFGLNTNIWAAQDVSRPQESDSLLYYYNLANNIKPDPEPHKTLAFYLKLKEQNLIKGDTFQAAQNLRQIAIIQNNLGDYYASETSVVGALKLLTSANNSDVLIIETKIGLYNQIGQIYRELLKYESAISYYNKGLAIATSQGHINAMKNNKALVFRNQEKYALAEIEFKEVYHSNLRIGNETETAKTLNNLGHVQSKLNNPLALSHLLEALEIRLSLDDAEGIYSSYKHLSFHYKDRNDHENALLYANKALEVAKSLKNVTVITDGLSIVLDLDTNPNIVTYKHLTDSINTAKQINENKNALLKYNVTEERKKTLAGEVQKKIAQNETLQAQALTIIVVLLSLFVYFIIRSRHKKEQQQQVYNTETRISKKVHDEVANDVYQFMTKLQGSPGVSEAILDDLEHIYTKARDISKDNSSIDFEVSFEETLNNLLLNYRSDSVGVITKGLKTISWKAFSNVEKITIYRVLQELMTNMKKHSNASITGITFSKNKNKVHIIYKDNGVGCVLKKQLGLRNTENRIASINGTITFESEPKKGFNAKIIV